MVSNCVLFSSLHHSFSFFVSLHVAKLRTYVDYVSRSNTSRVCIVGTAVLLLLLLLHAASAAAATTMSVISLLPLFACASPSTEHCCSCRCRLRC